MPKLRVAGVQLSGADPAGPRLRVAHVELTGAAITYPRLRVARIALAGPAAAIVLPLAAQTAGPGTEVTIAAAVLDSVVPDSWTWRQVSGPTVALTGAGGTRKLVAPSVMPPGATVVIGVRATKDGYACPEQTCAVTVLPQTRWARAPGGAWVGAAVAPG